MVRPIPARERAMASAAINTTRRVKQPRAMSADLADPAGLDPERAADWAASMTRSIRALSKFLRQVKESIQ